MASRTKVRKGGSGKSPSRKRPSASAKPKWSSFGVAYAPRLHGTLQQGLTRVARARSKGSDRPRPISVSEVAREGLAAHIAAEERRLGLSPIGGKVAEVAKQVEERKLGEVQVPGI